ncbi:MAG: PKD domain-containing protein [Actinobacteria bacterium]|nr:PKD domain-containing protein [Actinomycetota bacterium]
MLTSCGKSFSLALVIFLTFALLAPFAVANAGVVAASNHRPVARISAPAEALQGERVELDGTASSDADGDALTYRWSLAGRPAGSAAVMEEASSPKPWFVADAEGRYLVTLVVSDGKRASRPATAEIEVLFGRLSNPVSDDDYRPLARYGRSYLAQNGAGKKLLYLEGNARERGYATGFLCPRSVHRMTHDFVTNIVGEMLPTVGIDLDPKVLGELLRLLWPLLQVVATANMDAVPAEFLEEMRGISEGCRRKGYDVTFLDVLTLNLGFDVLESIFVSFAALFCNEFAVAGGATRGGRLYHGRDFMFPTGGGVFSDEALLIVQKPDSGYPFIASAAPGFVGVPTALNSRGVSCGMDMVASVLARPIITGEGSLLLCRKAVQYGESLEEATSLIRDSDRAVPWLYMIADGKQGEAVVLETTAASLLPPAERSKAFLSRLVAGILRVLFPWLEANGAGAGASSGRSWEAAVPNGGDVRALLDGKNEVRDQRGVMVRGMEYVDPSWLADFISYMERFGNTAMGKILPLQDERYPDLVAMTNHYVLPWKAVTYPSTGSKKDDSLWRYETMLALLLQAHGKIDRTRAMWIIDFLNPARCDYYGTDTSQAVRGHHVLMDNTGREMWSLHGYYDEAWAHADLDDFIR